ncbi:MAG: protein kinase [Sandaracinaceae bacterium]
MSTPIPFGSYELLTRIAEGGMAEVWRARSRGVAGFEKTVVIKRVLPGLMERPGFAELLVREAKIAARLNHPNIIDIFDLGEGGGGYFIAMEYLHGRDLAAALAHRSTEGEVLPLPLRLFVAGEVAKALDYAHRARGDDGKPLHIIHRDISPQNVLLGFEGEVKVADFGIARADDADLGRHEDPRILRGKYAYMSPEQARGEELDRRSDLFSLGVVLYEVATRRRLFRGGSGLPALERLRRGDIPDVRRHLPIDGLAPILTRALAPSPEDRYASAAELFADLVPLMFASGPVGSPDLAAAMRRMFRSGEGASPNKLRVDVLLRAQSDAHTLTRPPSQAADASTVADEVHRTEALPTSKRRQSETRTAALLAASLRPGEERLFQRAVEQAGGEVLAGVEPAVGVFGARGMEQAVRHAARAGLEVARACRLEGAVRLHPVPAMAILEGKVRVLDGALVALEDDAESGARDRLRTTEPGCIRADAGLEGQLRRELHLDPRPGGDLEVLGFRARKDRDASSLRQRSPLIGRREALARVSGILEEVAGGQARVVHVLGAPAMGKSRLLAELRAASVSTDYLFIHGRAEEGDRELPFAAFADLVEDVCGIEAEDPPDVRHAKVQRLRVLGLAAAEVRLLAELVGLSFPTSMRIRLSRPRAIGVALALRRMLRSLAREKVVVLALEALHWMDDATRQVLPLVVEHLGAERLMVLITRRPGSSGPLPKADHALELAPLDEAGTSLLAAHWIGADEVEPSLGAWLQEATGGVPGWVEPLVRGLQGDLRVEAGVARLDAPPRIPVPTTVQSAVRAWVMALRPRDRSMLQVAALFDGDVDVGELSAAEGLVGTTGRPSLRRLLVQRLMSPADAEAALPPRLGAWGGDEQDESLPESVRLPAHLLREGILADLDPRERARLHGRVVSALERLGAADDLLGLERLAHHARQSQDRRRAPDYFVQAGEAALAAADLVRAAGHLAEASRLRREEEGDVADPLSLELGLRAVDLALAGGRVELAERVIRDLRPLADRLEAEHAVQLALADARCADRRLDPVAVLEALAVVERAEPGDVPPSLKAEGWLRRGAALLDLGRIDEALQALGVVLATDGADDLWRGRALAAWGAALAHRGDVEGAEVRVQEALAVAARLGHGPVRYEALAALGIVAEAEGEHAEAARRFHEAAQVALEQDSEAAPALLVAAAAAAWRGGEADAARHATEAEAEAARRRLEPWGGLARAVRSVVAGEAGDVEALARALEASPRAAEAALAWELAAASAPPDGRPAALDRAATRARACGRVIWVSRLRSARDRALGAS